MNRIISFILLLLLSFGTANAQNDSGASKYESAENEYESGYFDTAKQLLTTSMSTFKGKYKENAYRLLALCALGNGKISEAKTYVSQMMKENPYYSTRLDDPQRLIDLVDEEKHQNANITTASQQAETIEETPVPVTVITEEMLHDIGARTLKEALIAYVPGMADVSSNEEMNIAMRGIYSSGQENILFMLNGHRLNSYSTNQATPDYSMSLEKVKQIEVLRGPASSIYGGVALTGVVNIITKDGNDVDGFKVKASGGNHGQVKGDFLFGKQYMGLDVFAWGSIYNATGEKYHLLADEQPYALIPVTGDAIIGGYNKAPSYDLGLNLKYNKFHMLFNRKFAKTVEVMAVSSAFTPYSYDNYMKLNGNAPGNAETSQYAELGYDGTLGKLHYDLKGFYDKQTQQRYQVVGDTIPDLGELTENYPYYTDAAIRMDKYGFQCVNWNEHTLGLKGQLFYEYAITPTQKGSILAGGEYNQFWLDNSSYLEGKDYMYVTKTYSDEKMLYTGTEKCADGFVQIKHSFNGLFYANAGLRYDYKKRRLGTGLSELSPRVALIFNARKFNIKASFSQAFVDAPYFFRSNNLDLDYGSEDLRPEFLKSLQLSFLSNGKLVEGLNLDANVFYNMATNFIVYNGMVAYNSGKTTIGGMELVAEYKIKDKFSASVNGSYQTVFNSEGYSTVNNMLTNISHFQSNFVLTYKLFSKLKLHTSINVMSKQTSQFSSITGSTEDIPVPARCTANLGAIFDFKKLSFTADVYNLFNTRYKQGGATVAPQVQAGRWFLAGVSYKF